jgi:hypothetical protein
MAMLASSKSQRFRIPWRSSLSREANVQGCQLLIFGLSGKPAVFRPVHHLPKDDLITAF